MPNADPSSRTPMTLWVKTDYEIPPAPSRGRSKDRHPPCILSMKNYVLCVMEGLKQPPNFYSSGRFMNAWWLQGASGLFCFTFDNHSRIGLSPECWPLSNGTRSRSQHHRSRRSPRRMRICLQAWRGGVTCRFHSCRFWHPAKIWRPFSCRG
jgi:hypothetical protein